MKKLKINREKQSDNRRYRKIKRLAKKREKTIETVKGRSIVAVTVSQAVQCQEDAYIGGLVRLLTQETGSHAIYAREQCLEQQNDVTAKAKRFIQENKIKVLIGFRFLDDLSGSMIEVSSSPNERASELLSFVRKVIQYSFEYEYRAGCGLGGTEIVRICEKEFPAALLNTAGNTDLIYVQVGINREYGQFGDKDRFLQLYNVLRKTIAMLVNLDWKAEKLQVYRLWQSSRHKPQDKIEIAEIPHGTQLFEKNSLLNICSYGLKVEKVRLHTPSYKTTWDLEQSKDEYDRNEYVFLTNRLIGLLFGREWIEGKEQEAGLRGAPVIVYENRKEVYPIGLPKANQIDGVFFSSALYEEKKEEASLFEYVIFNRYTDSRFHIKFEKADYADFGRVKDKNGLQAKKVMIPRYYKRLLGYLDYPVSMIRSEEFHGILENLTDEAEKKAFTECYELVSGDAFYQLKKKYDSRIEEADELSDPELECRKSREIVIDIQNRLGFYNDVEILRVPKVVMPKKRIHKRILQRLDIFRIWLLKKMIGKSEYLLKTEWTSETDDRNNIARLSPNMMSLLGISENDKILVKFGKKKEILRVLANEELTDYQIGMPAPARKKLGMNSINDIVIVHRDMVHIFWRHSEEQTIAILGTVLAVFQVITQIWIGTAVCVVVIPFMMYFVLNEERVKVK